MKATNRQAGGIEFFKSAAAVTCGGMRLAII
jgi:hypothetical protein